jgi:hypothetical protein
VIHVESSAPKPKEEGDGWFSTLTDFGASLVGPGKLRWAYRGYQFVQSWRDTDSPLEALQKVTVSAAKDKVVDTAVKTTGKVLKKVANKKKTSGSEPRDGDPPPRPPANSGVLVKQFGGKVRIPRGTHFALGRHETLEEFANQRGAVSIFGAHDQKYFNAAVDPRIFQNQFPDLMDIFIKNDGRIKFNLTGMEGGVESVTSWELRQILSPDRDAWRAVTDFFDEGVELTGQALERRLAPWR